MIRRSWIATSMSPTIIASLLVAGPVVLIGQMSSVSIVVGGGNQGTGSPYTANMKTSLIQKLADGTIISRTTASKEARDSQGRTYHETQLESGMGGPQRPNMTMYNVNDPIARVTMSWSGQGKEVNVFHMPEPQPSRPRPLQGSTGGVVESGAGIVGLTSGGSGTTGSIVAVAPPPILRTLPDTTNRPKTQRERLDGKNIAGVYAEGTRTTTTYPIGWFGNDRPIVQIQETWISQELHITMLTISDDPRSGTRTTEVTDLDRSEPSPALFQAPEGYKVREQNPQHN